MPTIRNKCHARYVVESLAHDLLKIQQVSLIDESCTIEKVQYRLDWISNCTYYQVAIRFASVRNVHPTRTRFIQVEGERKGGRKVGRWVERLRRKGNIFSSYQLFHLANKATSARRKVKIDRKQMYIYIHTQMYIYSSKTLDRDVFYSIVYDPFEQFRVVIEIR